MRPGVLACTDAWSFADQNIRKGTDPMKIYLLRHGETDWNKERRLQGIHDIMLNPMGQQQAHEAGEFLVRRTDTIDLILASPLTRAQVTARIVADRLGYPHEEIVTEPLFIERSFGAGEGRIYEELLAEYPDGNYPGMESLDALFLRAETALNHCKEAYSGQTILVVAHGAIIKAVLNRASQGKIAYFDPHVWIENGSFCCLQDKPQADGSFAWEISCFNHSKQYEAVFL